MAKQGHRDSGDQQPLHFITQSPWLSQDFERGFQVQSYDVFFSKRYVREGEAYSLSSCLNFFWYNNIYNTQLKHSITINNTYDIHAIAPSIS